MAQIAYKKEIAKGISCKIICKVEWHRTKLIDKVDFSARNIRILEAETFLKIQYSESSKNTTNKHLCT